LSVTGCSLLLIGAQALLGTQAADAGVVLGAAQWLEADVGVTTDGSGNVTNWADQSGNGHDATQSDSSVRPAFISNGLNGLPVIRFNGAGDFLGITGQVLTSQQFTIMAVVNDTRGSGDGSFREAYSNWSGTTFDKSVFLGTTGQNPVSARFTDDMGGSTDPNHNQTGVGVISNPGTHFIFTGVSDVSDASIYQNANLIADHGSALSTRDLSSTDGPYNIGTQGGFEFWQGDIAEILVYDRALTASELQSNWDYLDQKFAIQTPLPSSFVMSAVLLGMAGAVWSFKRLKRPAMAAHVG
jgi:hypothetical protein